MDYNKIQGLVGDAIRASVEEARSEKAEAHMMEKLYDAIGELQLLDRFLILLRLEGLTTAEIAERWVSSEILDACDMLDVIELDDKNMNLYPSIEDLPPVSYQAIQKREKHIINQLKEKLNDC